MSPLPEYLEFLGDVDLIDKRLVSYASVSHERSVQSECPPDLALCASLIIRNMLLS